MGLAFNTGRGFGSGLIGLVFREDKVNDLGYKLAIRSEHQEDYPVFGSLSFFSNPNILLMEVAVPGSVWEFGVEPIINEIPLKLIAIFTWLGRFISAVILLAVI
ncbi:MAG: hypothetical protein ACJAY8_000600 [Sphingobacteriales bacterium]